MFNFSKFINSYNDRPVFWTVISMTIGFCVYVAWTYAFLFIYGGEVSAGLNPCASITEETIDKHLGYPEKAKIVSKKAVGTICQTIVKLNDKLISFFVTEDFTIAGQMFIDRFPVSQFEIDGLVKLKTSESIPDLNNLVSMEYTPTEKPEHTIYMITDPLCPYCKIAQDQIIELADKHRATFKLILYSIRTPQGDRKAAEAICRDFTVQDYIDPTWTKREDGKDKYQCQEGEKLVQQTKDLMATLGISGVPLFVFDDGTKVVGADIKKLEWYLENGTNQIPPVIISNKH